MESESIFGGLSEGQNLVAQSGCGLDVALFQTGVAARKIPQASRHSVFRAALILKHLVESTKADEG